MNNPRLHVLALFGIAALAGGCADRASVPATPGAPGGGAPQSVAFRHPAGAVAPERPYHLVALGTPDRSHLLFATPDTSTSPTPPPGGLYVAQFHASSVDEYTIPDRSNTAPRCSVPGSGVNGIGVKSSRILYVPNANGTIARYHPDCGTALAPLTDTGQPADVAFDGTTVYVDNASTGAVDVFANGSRTRTGTLTNAAITGSGQTFGVAVDNNHNVYQSTTNNGGEIIEYTGGSGAGAVLALTGLSFPVGITFDSAQNMIVTNGSNAQIYASPYSGAPTRTFNFTGDGFYSKLDKTNAHLYMSDNLNGTVDVYTYSTGAYLYSISNGLTTSNSVEGVAVDPPSAN